MSEIPYAIDCEGVKELIPHRFPFLYIDKVTEFYDSHRIVAIKNVCANEWFFQGHFPNKAVMPGVIILESMAQAGAILASKSTKGIDGGKILYLVGADKTRWKRMVVPGDTLTIDMTFIKRRGPLWILEGEARVGDKIACSTSIQAMEAVA